ncbi:hypothetical protein HDU87_005186 [Geranomyces variabilis]|uniref:Uncharacterized protein n=1 Tax=Geranomyces variabilis TaxID=109894 RepID=A0AAD5THW0_9FUNG|nr:hypothetical protein HDU87_005186 [Geranomyces variabilis]
MERAVGLLSYDSASNLATFGPATTLDAVIRILGDRGRMLPLAMATLCTRCASCSPTDLSPPSLATANKAIKAELHLLATANKAVPQAKAFKPELPPQANKAINKVIMAIISKAIISIKANINKAIIKAISKAFKANVKAINKAIKANIKAIKANIKAIKAELPQAAVAVVR